MRSSAASGERTAGRVVALGIGAVLVSALLVVTAVVASTSTAQRVAANARSLHWANGSLGTAAIARASVAQAVFFAVDLDLGVASPQAVETALEVARHDLSLVRRISSGSPDGTFTAPVTTRDSLLRLADVGAEVLALADQGESSEAVELKATDFDPAFEDASQRLALHQQQVAAAIATTEELSGRIDTITRVGIMLALPTLAFAIYRRRARASLEAAKRAHAAEIEVERRAAKAKDEFFAAVSHGLRTPLTTILGFSELLGDGSVAPGEQAELADLIRSDAIDLERRIDDMVVAARSSAGSIDVEISSFDIAETARAAVAAASPTKPVAIDCAPAMVRADRRSVIQILRNLVSNADIHGGPSVTITGDADEPEYLITITDDGDGFERVPSASSDGTFAHGHREAIIEGSVGLGLAATIALTEANQGRLAYRRLGGLTQVGLFLPLDPPAIDGGESEGDDDIPAVAAA